MPFKLQLDLLRCPQSGGSLSWMSSPQLGLLRQAVEEAIIVNRRGALVTTPPEAALVCHTSALAYPVLHGIPILAADEAIAIGQFASSGLGDLDPNTPDDQPTASDD